MWVVLAALVCAAPPARAAGQDGAVHLGLPLTEALLALQDRGLKIAFTSHLVRPEMRVLVEPTSSSLPEILDELLAPHGLRAQAGASGLYVVVPRPGGKVLPKSQIRGQVYIRRTQQPLAGVRVLVPENGTEEVSALDGRFSLPALPPGTYTLEAHLPGFVVEQLSHVEVVAGRDTDISIALEPAPVPLDEIVVTPSHVSLLRSDPVAALAFDRDEILALPHLGDDLFRALTLLPGISGNELSAQFSIRGGRPDEVLVIFDNLELFEPFHLKDFSSAFSIIAPRAIGEVDLIIGGFPAEYGDRMGGVLEMSSYTPQADLRSQVGVALLSAHAGSSGDFRDGRGGWMALARRGGTELAQDYLDDEERPRFWDAFGKLAWRVGERNEIAARVLHADDDLDVSVSEGLEETTTLTGYGNSYLWLTHQSLLSSRFFVDSAVSVGRVHRDRRSEEVDPEDGELFSVVDQRDLDVAGLKQSWNLALGDRDTGQTQYLKWGFDARRLDTVYDYVSIREFEDSLDIRPDPRSGETVFQERFKSDQLGVYLSDRFRLGQRLTVELGLRYDEQSITRDSDLSPRFNLVAPLGEASTLRFAWGHYFQSQRIYELFVEDGETEFSPAERTEAFGIGFEHVFQRGETLRVNAYHRDVDGPRVRYENVLEPISKFPEVEPDRVRIEPDSSTSRGVEVFLRGRSGKKLDWWASYTYARVEDEIDGRDVPRSIDQPHTVNVDFSYKPSPRWTVNIAWRYHTGWPTTAVSGALEEDDEGELEPVLVFGPLNDERLPDYHRLDLRLSHRLPLKKRGNLTLFLELQNIYDRENVAGFDVDFDVDVTSDGQVVVTPQEEAWGSFLPSFGIDWEF